MNRRLAGWRVMALFWILVLAAPAFGNPPLWVAVDVGVDGLVGMQNPNGSWGDPEASGAFPLYRDTSVCLEALRDAGIVESAVFDGGAAFLSGLEESDLDLLARKILGLIGADVPLMALQSSLSAGKVLTAAPIGGALYQAYAWPYETGAAGNIMDTAIAYRALLESGYEIPTNGHIYVQTYIRGYEMVDGGWSFFGNETGDVYITSLVLLAMVEAPNVNPDLHTASLTGGRSFLLDRQNANGSWGSGNGLTGETGLVGLVLQRIGERLGDDAARSEMEGAAGWLRSNQLIDGSWPREPQVPPDYLADGDAFDTAASLRFLLSQFALSPTPTPTPEGTPGAPTSTPTPTEHVDRSPTPTATETPVPATPTETPTPPETVSTDINGDEIVDHTDLYIFMQGWGGTRQELDFDHDGTVSERDLLHLVGDYHTPGRDF